MKTKRCSKCGEEKDISEFRNNNRSKDKKDYFCKLCRRERDNNYRKNNKDKIKKTRKEYREKNKDKIKEKKKEYYKNNKDKIKEYNKEYRENNKDKIKEARHNLYQKNKDKEKDKAIIYNNTPILYNSTLKVRQEIELYEEIKQSDDGYLMCTCTYCGEWYKPIYRKVSDRLKAINNINNGEQRLYCSDNCKNNCPSYRQILYFKDQKPATSREVQPELRQMVFERDNYTCQKCDTYKDNLDVGIHCHHIEGILWEPLESADIDMCITYCADCHKEVHRIEGCTYQDLQCA